MARSEGLDYLLDRAKEKRAATAAPRMSLQARRSFLGGLGGSGPTKGTTIAVDPSPAPDDLPHVAAEARAIEQVADSAPVGVVSAPVADPPVSKFANAIDLSIEDEGLLGDIEVPGIVKRAVDDLFRKDSPHPVKLLRELFEMFGSDWVSWEPEMIWREIAEDRGHEPTRPNKDTIMAMLSLLVTESFWNEHHVFLHTVEALNGRSPDFSTLPEPRPEELAFAVSVANQVRDNHSVKTPSGEVVSAGVYYSYDVVNTIAALLHLNGLVWAPLPFQGQGEIDEDTDLPLPSVNDALAKLMDANGQALQTRMARLWKIIESEGIEDVDVDEETAESVQLARLVSIREYVRGYGD